MKGFIIGLVIGLAVAVSMQAMAIQTTVESLSYREGMYRIITLLECIDHNLLIIQSRGTK